MQSANEGNLLEVIDLAHTLRQEQLFVQHEKLAFENLNETLTQNSSCVAELAWICSQQRQNLKDLIVSKPESGPSICCQRANQLENVKFVDAYYAKSLKYEHVLAYIELFQYLHRSPYLLAQCLAVGDDIGDVNAYQMDSVVHAIATGLYGNAIHSKDVEMVLKLLRELIEIQIVGSDNPRRKLRAGSSAFSRLYYRLHESLFSAKIFLTAALHEPVIKVLIESESMLEVDPLKAVMNLPEAERSKKFGDESHSDYDKNVLKYRDETIDRLHFLASYFIEHLVKNWSLFPSTLRWLVQTMCHLLKQAHISDKNINEILTDMVFTHFICPAIVSPDVFGISDAPISEQARFNLMQIGRILQMLSLLKYEEVDPKFSDLYQKFETNIVENLLDQLLVSDCDVSIGVVAIRSQQTDFERKNVFFTQGELNILSEFLRTVLQKDELAVSGEDRRKLSKLLERLPDKLEHFINGVEQSLQQIQITQEHNSRAKQGLINLGKSTKNKIAKTMSLSVSNSSNALDAEDISTSGNSQNQIQNGLSAVSSSQSIAGSSTHSISLEDKEQVILFPISIGDENKFQLLTEAEVLKMNSIGQEIVVDPVLSEENVEKLDKVDVEFDGIGPVLRPVHAKTTRFSLSHDDASIGNSDNLEAVSEAPSNHSVTSSLELEENDQNDNLSDMVSANVSGRGTPNISGRDTPSSQVTEGENMANQIPTPQMAKILNKARSDIEDKFCKFEIKKLIEGDENISIISDTWSTDVLASDSETLDANERDRNFATPLIPSAVVLPGDNNFDPLSSSRTQIGNNFLDASETRSESAWSTDVLASDSEKLAEVDTDDNLSITAKSDITDTGRSENDLTRDQENFTTTNSTCAPDSPFFAPRVPSVNFRTPDSPMYGPRNSDSAFFSGNNASFEDVPVRGDVTSFASPVSSLARSSVRTTNQYSGENTFQQNYKSTSDRSGFLNANGTRIRRQNSAESSISNQSLNLEDCYGMKIKGEKEGEYERKNSKDLIDFTSFQEDGAAGIDKKMQSMPLVDDNNYHSMYDGYSEESVIHRRISSEQRNAGFDGRRNGILDFKSRDLSMSSVRRIQSLNYENHDIIAKRAQRLRNTNSAEPASVTDDFKTQQNVIDSLALEEKPQEHILNSSENISEDVTLSKPTKSTGAIPKSISFDASANKASDRTISFRQFNDSGRPTSNTCASTSGSGSGFFQKIKQGFKNRRSNKVRLNQDEYQSRNVSFIDLDPSESDRSRATNGNYDELNEDILAKYRRKVSTSNEAINSDSTNGSCSNNRKISDAEQRIPNGILLDKTFSFLNAKKKLRTVLATTDLHTGDFRHTTCCNASPLSTYLQIQFAQALNLHNLKQVSTVSEAIRCLNVLDPTQHQKLIAEMQADIIKRQSYLQYLMRYRQNLLSIIENIKRFSDRLRSDREMCNRHLIAVCVRLFLEKRESLIENFQEEFCGLTVVDEKIDLLEEFMIRLMQELKIDGILHGMADWQLEEARTSIERILLQRLYRHVMFPNDDGDISRDEVLHQHICKLQRVITPAHAALRIPQEYLIEAPWPFSQKQILSISAYKTPREKLLCVTRCISSIINALRMACDREPTADDLLPVFIYVVIKANPPYLLSTMQYVNCFLTGKLEGQDEFNWIQFCSVVQYIKTMDYLD